MDDIGVSKAILSITSPGTHLVPGNDAMARNLARDCNNFASNLKKEYPTRFGFWASLPLPDVQGSLVEIPFALDTLNANGFVLQTNHQGVYLGDPKFAPIFALLNERKATVFIHPAGPCMAASVGSPCSPATPLAKYCSPMLEFLFDTARCVSDLFISGTVFKHPQITFVISHCGGALPPLVERVGIISTAQLGQPLSTESVREAFQKQFFFDLAGFPFPDQIHGMLRLVDSSRLLYGSDFPFTPGAVVRQLAAVVDKELPGIFNEGELKDIYMGNAERLLESRSN
jgi:predicted TIM-barrel fold metal-dependent hydrolase